MDAMRVMYAYLHGESLDYLERFTLQTRFVEPNELLNALQAIIPDFAAEEAERMRCR